MNKTEIILSLFGITKDNEYWSEANHKKRHEAYLKSEREVDEKRNIDMQKSKEEIRKLIKERKNKIIK